MIIFDLDGTLADCEHRRHFVDPDAEYKMKNNEFNAGIINESSLDKEGGFIKNRNINGWKPDWQAFYEACDKDISIKPVVNMLWQINPYKKKIAIWSGRCESVKDKTIEWIIDQVFFGNFVTFDQMDLKMRPIGDYTPDDVLKERWLDEVIADGKHVDFVFDDRPKVIRMWRRRGIFVFNCCQHDEEF